MSKTVLLFSNPFGYGPTGKALAIYDLLQKQLKRDQVIFAGDGLCLEIAKGHCKHILQVDQRDTESVRNLLEQVPHPYVMSSQNRFAIKAARAQGISSAFIDGLAWFWKEIPEDHQHADITFWIDYPFARTKVPTNMQVTFVPMITGPLPVHQSGNHPPLLHLGGGENPLTATIPIAYLDLFATILQKLPPQPLTIAGGKKIMHYLRRLLPQPYFRIKSFPRTSFLYEVATSSHFLTTAGQTATMEAFSIGTPTSFLLPTNLSQYGLTEYLAPHGAAPRRLDWRNYIPVPPQFFSSNEREAINKIEEYSRWLLQDSRKLQRLTKDFATLLSTPPNQQPQEAFIHQVGTDGAETIVNHIVTAWGLQ